MLLFVSTASTIRLLLTNCTQAVKYLHKKCVQQKWLEPSEDEFGIIESSVARLGVLVRRPDGVYTAEPMFIGPDVVQAVEALGVNVAFTMSSEIIGQLLQQTPPLQTEIPLDPQGAATLPVVGSVEDIASGKATLRKYSYMCLCRNERFVLVWGNTVPGIIAHGTDIEGRLFGIVALRMIPSAFSH